MKLPETLQDFFDIAWNHAVVEKNLPSYSGDEYNNIRCLYRGPNNCKCLIGAAIPDEMYKPEIEAKGATKALETCGLEHRATNLRDLQACHDDAVLDNLLDYFNVVKSNLTLFATQNNLTIPGVS